MAAIVLSYASKECAMHMIGLKSKQLGRNRRGLGILVDLIKSERGSLVVGSRYQDKEDTLALCVGST